ncbi:cytochrome c oxidase subunit 7A-related protein, mitochondrial [Galendromus occidentalis]|uniref:Cytochrome c oxidase subunit 7A-related protein, mitochondrial n=1 Tax=Galendromus occidentalis TaxID=34638 RepID=A0AAJ7P9E4_9ACAR|nr:cytochrome c oxidase subunit 7A-related protein, mitochondrial [Galendromus occidentalis]
MNAARRLLRLRAPAVPKPASRQYVSLERIKQLQAEFQKDDGLPIHLKRGKRDLYMWRFIFGATMIATANSVRNLYLLVNKKI